MDETEEETIALRRTSEKQQDNEKKKTAYPIIRYSDVPEENKADIVDCITEAIERCGSDYDMAAKVIKDDMDRTYGPHWHAIVGESYGFEVTHQNQHILYMFYMGNLAILLWKNN